MIIKLKNTLTLKEENIHELIVKNIKTGFFFSFYIRNDHLISKCNSINDHDNGISFVCCHYSRKTYSLIKNIDLLSKNLENITPNEFFELFGIKFYQNFDFSNIKNYLIPTKTNNILFPDLIKINQTNENKPKIEFYYNMDKIILYQFNQIQCGSTSYIYLYGKYPENINLAEYAVKFYDMSSEISKNFIIEAFLNERQIFTKISNHKNVVKYYGNFISKTKKYTQFGIIMQYCNQGNLKNYLSLKKNEFLNEKECLQIFKNIIEGLYYLTTINTKNSSPILHRDLKLENILVHNDQIKLADFGSSSILKKELGLNKYDNFSLGTLGYQAPQILKEEEYTDKCDIWALGIILYYIFYRTMPWNDDNFTTLQILNFFENNKLNFPKLKNNEILSDDSINLIKQMLIIKEENRISWEELFIKFIDIPKNVEIEHSFYTINLDEDRENKKITNKMLSCCTLVGDSLAFEPKIILPNNEDIRSDTEIDKNIFRMNSISSSQKIIMNNYSFSSIYPKNNYEMEKNKINIVLKLFKQTKNLKFYFKNVEFFKNNSDLDFYMIYLIKIMLQIVFTNILNIKNKNFSEQNNLDYLDYFYLINQKNKKIFKKYKSKIIRKNKNKLDINDYLEKLGMVIYNWEDFLSEFEKICILILKAINYYIEKFQNISKKEEELKSIVKYKDLLKKFIEMNNNTSFSSSKK